MTRMYFFLKTEFHKTATEKMSRLIDELRQLTPGTVDPSLTEDEVQLIIDMLSDNAREAARRKLKSAGLCLDRFKRTGDRAKVAVPRARIPALERYFEAQGVHARYSDDMTCGVCNMNDCAPRKHYGYILEWEF